MLSAVAMLVATPLGLGAAVYLSEYASPRARRLLKPILEVLASIPSVVLGFFALIWISPNLVQPLTGAPLSTMASAGLAVGILITPLVASVSEDAMHAVPRDLREVYWNDPRRRQLRTSLPSAIGHASTELSGNTAASRGALAPTSRTISTLLGTGGGVSQLGTPLEYRLARILEVNSELAGELDVERLTSRITGHAVELARAERGFVILREGDGSLSVHASRGGTDPARRDAMGHRAAEAIGANRGALARTLEMLLPLIG